MATPSIPQIQHDLVRGTKIDTDWYRFLQKLAQSGLTTAEVDTQVATAIAAMSADELSLRGLDGISVLGNAADGYFVKLNALGNSGVGAALVKITRDGFGRVEGTQAATTDDLPEGAVNKYASSVAVFNRIDSLGDIRVAADGSLRITNGT